MSERSHVLQALEGPSAVEKQKYNYQYVNFAGDYTKNLSNVVFRLRLSRTTTLPFELAL
jgi:hypothetical protein